jgi:hypothetical protein
MATQVLWFEAFFTSRQWIELSNDLREIEGKHGTFVQVTKVEGDKITVDPHNGPVNRADFADTPTARRWDQQETEETKLYKGVIPIVEGKWFTLEDRLPMQIRSAALRIRLLFWRRRHRRGPSLSWLGEGCLVILE